MELSSALVKEFASVVNDTNEEVTSSGTAYGTIVSSNGRKYVLLDGATSMTAISEATDAWEGDRVIVTITNHVATVTSNLTSPASGRTASEVSNDLVASFEYIEANYADFNYLSANYIDATTISSMYATIEYLQADFGYIDYLESKYINTEELYANFARIESAIIDEAQIEELIASHAYITEADIENLNARIANIEEAYITYAEIEELYADVANINQAFIDYAAISYAEIEELYANLAVIQDAYITEATVNELLAGYALITDLDAAYASITNLDASIANITRLLSGEAGVGILETIYLTADNVVIDSAVIVDALVGTVLADIIKSNVIYTDYITIRSEDGSYVTSGATTQYFDADGNVRIQIGLDANGDFTFVLYGSGGTGILLDENGLHASAVPDGLIVDSMVADDANISADKINMQEVTQYLNTSGDLVLDAYQIYIDGTTLDYKLTEITESAVSEVVNYYAIGTSPDEPPCDPDETIYDAICGIAICGLSYVDTIGWTTRRLYAEDGQYLWFVQKKIYADGSYSWTEPTCLTDDYTRTKVSTAVTELEVVQGQIEAKVWLTDIEEATGVLGDQITTITDQYGDLIITVNEIDERVGLLTTSMGADFEYLYSEVANITVQLEEIDLGVSQSISYIYNELESISSEGIKSRTAYFAISYSPNYCPGHDLTYSAVTGIAVCGLAICGNTGYWTTEQPLPEDGEYVWISWLVETIDGDIYWEDPILLTDYQAREQISYMSSKISGMQILIDEIDIGISDIYSYVDTEIGYVSSSVADIILDLDSISASLTSLESLESEHYNYFCDQYSGISIELESVTTRVEKVESESGEAVKRRKAFFAISYSPDYYPSRESLKNAAKSYGFDVNSVFDSTYTSICGIAICGLAVCGNTGLWTDEQPTPEEGEYVWVSYLVETISGEIYWEDPILLSDDAARKEISYMSERYAEVAVSLDEINLEIYSMYSDMDSMLEQITSIDMELGSMSLTVYESGSGMASITMTVGDKTESADVVTNAREAFEAEDSRIQITAGTIEFLSNTLLINSEQFKLDGDGNATFSGELVAASGTFEGSVTAESAPYKAILSGGSLEFYYSDSLYGYLTAFANPSGTEIEGIYCSADFSVAGKLLVGNTEYTSSYMLFILHVAGNEWINSKLVIGGSVYDSSSALQVTGAAFINAAGPTLSLQNQTGSGYTGVVVTSWNKCSVSLRVATDGIQRGVYDDSTGSWLIYRDTSGYVNIPDTISSLSVQGNITNAGYITAGNWIRTDNGYGLYIKSSDGTYRTAIQLTSSNNYNIGTNSFSNNIYIGSSGYTSTLGLRGSTIAVTGAMTVSGAVSTSSTIISSGNITVDKNNSTSTAAVAAENYYNGVSIRATEDYAGLYYTYGTVWIVALEPNDGYLYLGNNAVTAYMIGGTSASSNVCTHAYLLGVLGQTTSSGAPVYINSNQRILQYNSSSIRYKDVIRELDANDIKVLFNIPTYLFTYKEHYLIEDDERYMKPIPGFIAEEWENVMPIAVNHMDGKVETWNSNIVVPLMFEMIKYNHTSIEIVEDRIDVLQLEIDQLKAENTALKQELADLKAA